MIRSSARSSRCSPPITSTRWSSCPITHCARSRLRLARRQQFSDGPLRDRDRPESASDRSETLDAAASTALVLGVSQGVQGFVDLPNVQREVAAVQQIEGGKELLDDGFSRRAFEAELKQVPYSVVHIASHGQFGTDPSQTFVLAFDGQLTMDDLEADIKFGERRDKRWNCWC